MIAVSLECLFSACSGGPEQFTTVVLVRHAEKELTGDDPGLTELGAARAAELAHVTGEMGVDAVYTTQYLRTRATAEPLAHLLGLEVQVVTAGTTYAADMAELVRSQHYGETVVIVSHSNTVPEIIGELGVTPAPVIDDDEYDDLYVVLISQRGHAHLVPLRYGSETP